MTSKHLDKLKRWIRPRGGESASDAGAERLIAGAEHELTRVRRDLEEVLAAKTDSAPATLQRKL